MTGLRYLHIFLISILFILGSSCSHQVNSTHEKLPETNRELASSFGDQCREIVSKLMNRFPNKEDVRSFIARTYKKIKIDPNVLDLSGRRYGGVEEITTLDQKVLNNVYEFTLGKKLGPWL